MPTRCAIAVAESSVPAACCLHLLFPQSIVHKTQRKYLQLGASNSSFCRAMMINGQSTRTYCTAILLSERSIYLPIARIARRNSKLFIPSIQYWSAVSRSCFLVDARARAKEFSIHSNNLFSISQNISNAASCKCKSVKPFSISDLPAKCSGSI